MVKDLSRSGERRGTRGMLVGMSCVALLLIVGAFVWLLLPTSNKSDRLVSTGVRSQQVQGSSSAAKQNPAPSEATANETNPETVAHAQEITASASKNLSLDSAQRKAVDDFVEQNRSRVAQPSFTVSVGAAVPKQVDLADLPTGLTDTLKGYNGDQFVLLPTQLVIVERATRRIVAIIPTIG